MKNFFKKLGISLEKGAKNAEVSEQKEVIKKLPGFIEYSEKKPAIGNEIAVLSIELRDRYGLSSREASDLALYLTNLDLRAEELTHKQILDLGSGWGYFKNAMEKVAGMGKAIINFDEVAGNVDAVGRAEALPFADASFDLVIAHCSVPIMDATSGNYKIIPQSLREMLRVVGSGGAVKVFPVALTRDDAPEMAREYLQMGSTVLEELENIHKSYPDVKIKVVETTEQSGDTRWLLELLKPEIKIETGRYS